MSTQPLDPRSALVALRIAELRREARAAALARRVGARRPRTRSWSQAVVDALRETFLHASARDAAPCPSC